MNIYICNILTYISQMILNIVEYNLHDNAFDAQRAKLNKKNHIVLLKCSRINSSLLAIRLSTHTQ